MKTKNLVGAVLGTIGKVVFAVVVVYIIYRGASTCYDYGYRIFTEDAISSGTGREVTVTFTSDMSPTEIGEVLEQKGLVRDAKLFALQYYCSEYRKDWKAGTYTLSTAMDAEEMMEVMAGAETADDTEETAGSGLEETDTVETAVEDITSAQ